MADKVSPYNRETEGPFDASEVGFLAPHLDFESLRVSPKDGMQIRAEIEENSKRIIALTLDFNGSLLQLQAFAAPKSAGLWLDAIAAMKESLTKQSAKVIERQGALGPELAVEAIVEAGGKKQLRQSIFLAVDGPRWLLRGVLMGKAAADSAAYAEAIRVFRSVVVDRGDTPLPPNELLPLRLPKSNQTQS